MHGYLYWCVYWCVLYCADVYWCVLMCTGVYWCSLMCTGVSWLMCTDVPCSVHRLALCVLKCTHSSSNTTQINTKMQKGAHSGTVRNLHKCIQPCIIAAGVWSVAFVFDTPCWCFTENIKNKKDCKFSSKKKFFMCEMLQNSLLSELLWALHNYDTLKRTLAGRRRRIMVKSGHFQKKPNFCVYCNAIYFHVMPYIPSHAISFQWLACYRNVLMCILICLLICALVCAMLYCCNVSFVLICVLSCANVWYLVVLICVLICVLTCILHCSNVCRHVHGSVYWSVHWYVYCIVHMCGNLLCWSVSWNVHWYVHCIVQVCCGICIDLCVEICTDI